MPKTMLAFLILLAATATLASAAAPSSEAASAPVGASGIVCAASLQQAEALPAGGRFKQDDPAFCDPTEPNGSGTSKDCKAAYNPVCPAGYSPGSESCSVLGSCNDPATGFVGTECDCSVWCVKDN